VTVAGMLLLLGSRNNGNIVARRGVGRNKTLTARPGGTEIAAPGGIEAARIPFAEASPLSM